MKRLLFRESEVQPLLVILEDLHTIDPDTQALIDGLVDSLPTGADSVSSSAIDPSTGTAGAARRTTTQIRMNPLAPPERVGIAGRARRHR